MTVLIVDDNDTNRKLRAAILAGSGYRIREAADGEKAFVPPPQNLWVVPSVKAMATYGKYRIIRSGNTGIDWFRVE